MTSADDVRRVGLALPRTHERMVRGRLKLRVGQIVYVAFSVGEEAICFGYPRAEREGLVASDPATFFLPSPSDMRFQWVCARLARLHHDEMRELVTDAWRMCVPRMLHDLPELPAPAAEAWAAADRGDWERFGSLLHPDVAFVDRSTVLEGREAVLRHLRDQPRPKPPRSVAVERGLLRRWSR